MTYDVDRAPLNLVVHAPWPARARVDPFKIPGVTKRNGDLVFPWSARKVVWKLLGIPPGAMRHPPVFKPVARVDEAKLARIITEPERLRPFQPVEVAAAAARGGGHLWTPPGAGKTLMGMAWGCAVTEDPILWVTRACLRDQTVKQAQQWILPEAATPLSLRPPSARRKHNRDDLLEMCLRAPSRPILIVGWEQLRDETFVEQDVLPLVDRLNPEAVVFDETQFAKAQAEWFNVDVNEDGGEDWSSGVEQTVAGGALLAAEAIPFRLGLTATPGETDRSDLHGQLRLIEPHAWGRSGRKFYVRYCGAVRAPRAGEPLANGGMIPDHLLTMDPDEGAHGPTNTAEFWARVNEAARRVPYETTHGHLPPVHRHVHFVGKNEQATPLESYNKVKRRLATLAEKGDKSARAEFLEVEYAEAAEKVRTYAIELCRQRKNVGKGKGILYSSRKALADKFAYHLERAGFRVYVLHGDVADEDFLVRKAAADADPGPCVVVGTPDKLGTGFDMPDFDFTIFAMLPNRIGLIGQAEARADRLSRTRKHEIIFLVPEGSQIEWDLRRLRDRARATADVHHGSSLEHLDQLFGGSRGHAEVLRRLASVLTA